MVGGSKGRNGPCNGGELEERWVCALRGCDREAPNAAGTLPLPIQSLLLADFSIFGRSRHRPQRCTLYLRLPKVGGRLSENHRFHCNVHAQGCNPKPGEC